MAERGPASEPTFADIEAAAIRLVGHAVVTPILTSPALDERAGGGVLIKPENLQRTGSFKFRGAYNKIAQIPKADRAAGVVAFSSGNHAQGVAAAAQLLDIPATIVMPADAPDIKIENTRSYGAEVLLYDRYREAREEVAAALVAERGATLVRPYDDPDVIAGQGTCGLEIGRHAADMALQLDVLLVCCGGGGLTAGIAMAMAELSPRTAIHTVEPEGFEDTARSLAAGRRLANETVALSICDALLAPTPGEITFAINRRLVAGGLVVSDEETREAMAFAFRQLKLVVEPGGAVALAAVLSGKMDLRGKTTAVIISGGNVDPGRYAEVISARAY